MGGQGRLREVHDSVRRRDKTKAPVIRESLKVLSLTHGGAGRTVWTDEYQLWADHRAFSRPQLAPDGRWFLTGEPAATCA